MTKKTYRFDRILLKISGEALGGSAGTGIDPATLDRVAMEIADLAQSGKQVGVVMGAGNFFRGIKGVAEGMDRVTADQMGMVATILNALALRDALDRAGTSAVVLSAFPVGEFTETFSAKRGREILENGAVALCAGGTGNPLFTTDTAATLRALELKCDVMFKATMVDGVYDSDPVNNPDAVRFDRITYREVIDRELKVMDLTSVTLAEANDLPLVVFNMWEAGTMKRVAGGEVSLGTLITRDSSWSGLS